MVRVIHSAVKGRIRYKVQGLYRSETLKRDLESKLRREEDVSYVSAGVLTGNILVVFDPECNPRKIASIIEAVATAYFQRVAQPGPESASHIPQEGVDDNRSHKKDGRIPARVSRRTPAVAASKEQRTEVWHLMDPDTVLAMMKSSPKTGLTKEKVAESLKNYGLNVVPERGARSKLGMFIDQFLSIPVYLLAGAAGLSVLTGGVIDAAVIMSVVGLNAVIGYFTESAAEKTISSLKQLVRPSAQVVRDGDIVELPSEEVLIGDILALRPGVYVTADARLVEATHLSIDESVLTGESMPVTKTADILYGKDIPLADRVNMVYSGTLVTGGQGLAVVVATGSYSEIGRVQALTAEAEAPETPVEKQLGTIGNQLVAISAGVCALIFFIGLLRGNGFIEMLKTAVSLAVAAVPEGLPAVATTTLALGIRNMRKHKVLIRELEAVTTLGSVETICFDKTGTITLNRMTVLKVHSGMRLLDVHDGSFTIGETFFNPYASDEILRLIHVCTLCNESEVSFDESNCVVNGSATENALIHMAVSTGVDVQDLRGKYPLLKMNYRTETCHFMTTLHSQNNDGQLLAVKGSPVDVLNMCNNHIVDGEKVPLSHEERDLIEFENDRMAGDALRVLGVAYAPNDCGDLSCNGNGLTWLGLVGMADPIRDRVKEAVGVFQKAGLNTIMITGDQSATAYAVGRALNLSNGQPIEILDSSHVADADPAMMKSLCKNVHVFSRVSPSHKLQIVQALQSTGKVVAMTGDGINDGPALKAADIGIAMGRSGTEVAREVADVVLEHDDLETLIVALSDGRTIYNNIRKTLHYLLATNFSEILVMFSAGALGLGHPLNAMQLLWINLVTDVFPGLALALEPPEPDVLSRPPRASDEPIVKVEDYKRITFEATAITCAALASYGYGFLKYGAGATASTFAFQTLTTSQILHALTCRSETRTIFDENKPPPNKYLTLAVVLSLGFQLLSQLVPGLRNLLGVTPITLVDGALIGATSVLPMLITEAAKKTTGERKSEPRAGDLPADVVHVIQ